MSRLLPLHVALADCIWLCLDGFGPSYLRWLEPIRAASADQRVWSRGSLKDVQDAGGRHNS
eukprot:286817-Amphidinium_carterae.1